MLRCWKQNRYRNMTFIYKHFRNLQQQRTLSRSVATLHTSPSRLHIFMYTWRHIAEAMPLFWFNDVLDNVPYESGTQIFPHFEQFLFRTLGDESIQIPRSVAQQHP